MKKIETSRDALRDIAAVFPEILNLSVFQTILNRAPDDAAFERMEAAFQAEIDAHDPKDSDLGCDATDATLPVPRKTPDATPAPTLSTGTQTITIRIPAAILNSCRVQAKKSCIPYQTLIIRTLKAAAAEWVKPVSQL